MASTKSKAGILGALVAALAIVWLALRPRRRARSAEGVASSGGEE